MAALLMAATPFILNVAMSFSKWMMGKNTMTTPGKRFLLALFALAGVVISNDITGGPIQIDSITNLLQILFESFAAFIAAHGSYHLFWKD